MLNIEKDFYCVETVHSNAFKNIFTHIKLYSNLVLRSCEVG